MWLRYPFYGHRRITKELRVNGIRVNYERAQGPMVLGGIQALFPGPNTSQVEQAACCILLLIARYGNSKAQPGVNGRY